MLSLIAFAMKLGVPERFAKLAVIAVMVFGTLTILGIAKCSYDRNLIKAHDAKQEAATAKADRKADTKAAEQRRTDDTRLTNERTELEGSTSHAQTDLDRRLAFQRCLRLQQAARASHGVVPSCH